MPMSFIGQLWGQTSPVYWSNHNKVEVQSNTTYIYYRWFTKLSTTTCFGLYIGHLQVVLFFVLRLTIQYTMCLLLLTRSCSHLRHSQITLMQCFQYKAERSCCIVERWRFFLFFWVVVTGVKCMVPARDVMVDIAEFCSVLLKELAVN